MQCLLHVRIFLVCSERRISKKITTCTSPQFEYKLHQVAEGTGMSVIHTYPCCDGKMKGHSSKHRTNLDQIRPQKIDIGELKKVSNCQRQWAPYSGEAESISMHTRSKAFPMQPRAVPISKATHSSCSAVSAAWHRRRKSRQTGLTRNVSERLPSPESVRWQF